VVLVRPINFNTKGRSPPGDGNNDKTDASKRK
jgi:hypothetical protein